jgi:hypothetical protein
MNSYIKDRWIYASTGGLFIPISYGLLLYFLIDSSSLSYQAFKWIAVPVFWPVYICKFVFPSRGDGSDFLLGLVLLLLIFGNFALYFTLTYLGVRWKQRMPRLR